MCSGLGGKKRQLVDGDDITEEQILPDAPAEVAVQRGERAGVYLAALAALAVPSLIVIALFLPTEASTLRFDLDNGVREQGGLDSLDVTAPNETQSDEAIPVVVGGAGQAQDDVTTEIGEPAGVIADVRVAGPTDSAAAPVSPQLEASGATSVAPTAPPIAPTSTTPTTTQTSTAPTTSEAVTPTTTEVTATTEASTTTVVEPPDPDVEPLAFAKRVDIGRIGETTLQFRFSSAEDSDYTATIRSGSDIVARATGAARANVLVNETVQGLDPGISYSVQVELAGQPSVRSPRVAFRTSGGDAINPSDKPVAIQNVRLAQVEASRFEVHYDSTICANGSFVIREDGGPIVGSNDGQASGCTTRHLAIPGFWTSPLKPNTNYVLTFQVEANGAGRGNGNVATRSLSVTTTG